MLARAFKLKTFLYTIGIILLLFSSVLLHNVPAEIDVLNLNQLSTGLLIVFGALPIGLFDFLTGGAFRPHGEGFIVLPSLPQALFALIFDLVLIHLCACALSAWVDRRAGRGAAAPK